MMADRETGCTCLDETTRKCPVHDKPYNQLYRPPQADVLEKLIRDFDIHSVIEIGTFLGQTARFFAERVDSVLCVDPFYAEGQWAKELEARGVPNPFYDVFVTNMKKYRGWDKITVYMGKSEEFAKVITCEADLVYIDGDHSYEGCSSDIQNFKDRAKKLLAGDDFHRDENGRPYFPGVIEAVEKLLPGYQYSGMVWWKGTEK